MSVCPTRGFYSTHPLKEPLGQFNHSATVLESEENIKEPRMGRKSFIGHSSAAAISYRTRKKAKDPKLDKRKCAAPKSSGPPDQGGTRKCGRVSLRNT